MHETAIQEIIRRNTQARAMFISRKVVFGKPLSKLSCVYLSLEKSVNRKHFQSKKNLAWFPGKCFPEKFRNIILFADYIKFGPQTFDCYIYIYIYIYCFEYLFFNFIS